MHLHAGRLLEIYNCVFSAYHCIFCDKETLPETFWHKMSEEKNFISSPTYFPAVPSGKVQTHFNDIVLLKQNEACPC